MKLLERLNVLSRMFVVLILLLFGFLYYYIDETNDVRVVVHNLQAENSYLVIKLRHVQEQRDFLLSLIVDKECLFTKSNLMAFLKEKDFGFSIHEERSFTFLSTENLTIRATKDGCIDSILPDR